MIKICSQRGKSKTSCGVGNAGFLRDVSERTIAVIVIKRIHARLQSPRPTHHVNPFPLAPSSLTRPGNGVVIEIHIAHDKEICLAVAVVIDKTATGAPLVSRSLESS